MTATSMRSISLARRAAFAALQSVSEGAYASDTLLELCRSLTSRDAGLASQIVFGCLRYQAQLDFLLQHYSGKRPQSLDLPVLLALRAALFQLRYLERIPPHAAVNDSVEYVKKTARSASGFVNAVLRKVNRDPVPWPSREVELSCPEWLIARWASQFGDVQASEIARAALAEPETFVRIPPGQPVNASAYQQTEVPGCYRLFPEAPERTGPAEFRFQDIGSQAILPLLDLQSGQSYLDVCSAPGNKTLQAAETSLGLGVACDVSLRRLATVPPVFPRVVLDATQPLPFRRSFDRIFVDAPCSGTGTIGRNPEIKWRVHPEDFSRFQEKQTAIVLQALHHLEPGGKLLYATCSLEGEENEQVVRAVLAVRPKVRCERELLRLPGREPGDGFYAAVLS